MSSNSTWSTLTEADAAAPAAALPTVSVVVPALNEAAYLRRTVEHLQATLPPASEIVVVDDGSTDGGADFAMSDGAGLQLVRTSGCGVAGARNLGAQMARGRVLVFVDSHVETPRGWCEPLVAALDNPSVGAAAPALSVMDNRASKGFGLRWRGPDLGVEWLGQLGRSPYPVPLLPGACLAIRRETFAAVGGFDSGMIRWGSEDAELSLRLWLQGYQAVLVPQVEVAHAFRPRPPYQVSWAAVLHNMLRVAFVHFNDQRIVRVVEALKGYRDFAEALSLSVSGDAWTRRTQLAEHRRRDDDWFFHSFEITC